MELPATAFTKNDYSFNEIASITEVKPYVLRFWEAEFSQISPQVLEDGKKVYSKNDIEKIHQIKKLLFEDKMTINQAKSALFEEPPLVLKQEILKMDLLEEAQPAMIEETNSSIHVQKAKVNRSTLVKNLDLTKISQAKRLLLQAKETLSKLSLNNPQT